MSSQFSQVDGLIHKNHKEVYANTQENFFDEKNMLEQINDETESTKKHQEVKMSRTQRALPASRQPKTSVPKELQTKENN